MNPKFKKRFNHLQKLLADYENEVENLSFEQANQIPASGGWTIAQVIHHISHVEKSVILYIQKKLINPKESKKSGIKSSYRAALLRYALRSKRKFKAPKVLENPVGPYQIKELIDEWKLTRKELEKLLDSVSDADINRELFKHPVVGKINLKQTLGFMGDHTKRHLDQIVQLKKLTKN